MKRRLARTDTRPPRELVSFDPRRHATQAEMDEADRWDARKPGHPGLTVDKSTKIQLDAFWRWMAERDRWCAEHGWTDDDLDAA